MGTVSITDIAVGSPRDIEPINTRFTAIATQLNGNIDVNNLADLAVTTAKIGANQVTGAKIGTGNTNGIQNANIADDAVTIAKVADTGWQSTGLTAGSTWTLGSYVYRKVLNVVYFKVVGTYGGSYTVYETTNPDGFLTTAAHVATFPTGYRPVQTFWSGCTNNASWTVDVNGLLTITKVDKPWDSTDTTSPWTTISASDSFTLAGSFLTD